MGRLVYNMAIEAHSHGVGAISAACYNRVNNVRARVRLPESGNFLRLPAKTHACTFSRPRRVFLQSGTIWAKGCPEHTRSRTVAADYAAETNTSPDKAVDGIRLHKKGICNKSGKGAHELK